MEKPCANLGAIAKTIREPASRLLPCQRLAGLPHKISLAIKGENNHRWKGGVSKTHKARMRKETPLCVY